MPDIRFRPGVPVSPGHGLYLPTILYCTFPRSSVPTCTSTEPVPVLFPLPPDLFSFSFSLLLYRHAAALYLMPSLNPFGCTLSPPWSFTAHTLRSLSAPFPWLARGFVLPLSPSFALITFLSHSHVSASFVLSDIGLRPLTDIKHGFDKKHM